MEDVIDLIATDAPPSDISDRIKVQSKVLSLYNDVDKIKKEQNTVSRLVEIEQMKNKETN